MSKTILDNWGDQIQISGNDYELIIEMVDSDIVLLDEPKVKELICILTDWLEENAGRNKVEGNDCDS